MPYQITRTAAAFATALALSLSAMALYAQVEAPIDINERLLTCDKLADPSDRLDCFNAVTQSLKMEPGAAPAAVAAKTDPAADQSRPAPTSEPEPVEIPASTEETQASVPSAVAAPVTQTSAHKPAESPVSVEVDDFGRESMETGKRKDQEENQVIQATIVRVWTHHDDRFSVELDNGQIWRETAGSRIRRRVKIGRSVEIKKGALGSYRMIIDGIPMAASVRRTK